MNFPLILSIASLTLAIVTLFLTFLNFRRNQTFENENHIFKLRIEVYNKFVFELCKLLVVFEGAMEKIEDHHVGLHPLTNLQLHTIADQIDDESFKLAMFFAENQLLLGDAIIQKISRFCEDGVFENENSVWNSTILRQKVDQIFVDADVLINELRNDLSLNRLNQTLLNRLRR